MAAVSAIAALAGATGTASAAPPPETGVWIDHTGDGAVEIYVCNDRADRLCGRIVWLKEPLNAQGVPKFDRHNPNEAQQRRPICGLPVIGNLAKVEGGEFDQGWIYDPKVGKAYDAAMKLEQPNRLVVTGYLGMRMLGKSFVWTRAAADQPRCEGAPPPPKAK